MYLGQLHSKNIVPKMMWSDIPENVKFILPYWFWSTIHFFLAFILFTVVLTVTHLLTHQLLILPSCIYRFLLLFIWRIHC